MVVEVQKRAKKNIQKSMTETELDDEFYSQLKLSRAMNGDK